MKAKLIKVDTGWILMVDNKIYASHNDILSIKNCHAIERGYDLDELANNEFPYDFDCPLFETLGITEKSHKSILIGMLQGTLQKGFQKAIELMGDNRFSEEDILGAMEIGFYLGRNFDDDNTNTDLGWLVDKKENYILSLQQTEWDVEVVEFTSDDLKSINNEWHKLGEPKLDADGCLILKRI